MNADSQFYGFLRDIARECPDKRGLVEAIARGYGRLCAAGAAMEAADDYSRRPGLSQSGFGYTVTPGMGRPSAVPARDSSGYTVNYTRPAAGQSGQAGIAAQSRPRRDRRGELREYIERSYPAYVNWASHNGKPVMNIKEYAADRVAKNNEYRMQKWRDAGERAGYMPRAYTLGDIFPEYAAPAASAATPGTSMPNNGMFLVGDHVVAKRGANAGRDGVIVDYGGCICTVRTSTGHTFEENDSNLVRSSAMAASAAEAASDGARIAAANPPAPRPRGRPRKASTPAPVAPFGPGDRVQVIGGYLDRMYGHVVTCGTDSATIRINAFGQDRDVTVPVSQLVPDADTVAV